MKWAVYLGFLLLGSCTVMIPIHVNLELNAIQHMYSSQIEDKEPDIIQPTPTPRQ